MTVKIILVALLWGAVGGLLALHAFANLLAVGFCLHGLLMTRWKRLAKKIATGAVNYGVNLHLLLKVGGYALLFTGLVHLGDEFVRREFRFAYTGIPAVLAGLAACTVFALRVRSVGRRLEVIWKMSHHFDYAQRRQRTRMLKS